MTPPDRIRARAPRRILLPAMSVIGLVLWLVVSWPPRPFSSHAAVDAQGQAPSSGMPVPASALVYVSDYVSFVGADRRGRIAFALDTNRGRDGEAFQAEHFVILHDEQEGWIDLAGNGRYENARNDLLRIPDSPFFTFEGTPETGLTITSGANRLTLRVAPIPPRRRRTVGHATRWMGSAPAVLTWHERTVPGRLIYEFLLMPDFNRLTRTYVGLWKEFQGLYLFVEGGGDLYLHSQLSERLAPLAGTLGGFAVLDEQAEPLEDLAVAVLDDDSPSASTGGRPHGASPGAAPRARPP